MSDPVVSEAEIEALKNLGYCNVGNGWVARVGRGGARNLLNEGNNCFKAGIHPNELQGMSDNRQIEHLWRSRCAVQIQIGRPALTFPNSESTMTHYVIGGDEENRLMYGVAKRLPTRPGDPDIITADGVRLAEKRRVAEIEKLAEDERFRVARAERQKQIVKAAAQELKAKKKAEREQLDLEQANKAARDKYLAGAEF